MKKTIFTILLNALPLLFMMLLIPFIQNDHILLLVYVLIIALLLFIKYEPREYIYFLFGFFVITFFEWVFVSTGAETFQRRSLLNTMPIWLPVVWAYAFIAIKRSISAINEYFH